MMILGKKHTGNDRQRFQSGEFHSLQDFAERLNPIPRSAKRMKAVSIGALKISTESDDFIFDEIHRRDRLEIESFKDEMEEDDEGQLEDE